MESQQRLGRRLAGPLLALLLLLTAGTLGYVLIEGWPLSDAFFMAGTTITTVGFGEIRPLTTIGRIYTVGLIIVGLAGLWYALSVLVAVVVEGQLGKQWERRRMERRVERLDDHHLLCGYGRVGRRIGEELRREGRQVVVIDLDPAALAEAERTGLLVVEGNATEDAVLIQAGIERAAGLISAVGADVANVFVTLSARALRADLPIVARANDDDTIPKLRRAGATQVVSPYATAGRQMARLVLRPATVDFIETLMRGANAELLLEDVRVDAGSALVGLTIGEARTLLREATLFAVQRDGQLLAPPPADLRLRPGDVIAAVGGESQLRRLEDASKAG